MAALRQPLLEVLLVPAREPDGDLCKPEPVAAPDLCSSRTVALAGVGAQRQTHCKSLPFLQEPLVSAWLQAVSMTRVRWFTMSSVTSLSHPAEQDWFCTPDVNIASTGDLAQLVLTEAGLPQTTTLWLRTIHGWEKVSSLANVPRGGYLTVKAVVGEPGKHAVYIARLSVRVCSMLPATEADLEVRCLTCWTCLHQQSRGYLPPWPRHQSMCLPCSLTSREVCTGKICTYCILPLGPLPPVNTASNQGLCGLELHRNPTCMGATTSCVPSKNAFSLDHAARGSRQPEA